MKTIKDRLDTQPATTKVKSPFAELEGNGGFPSSIYIIQDPQEREHALIEIPEMGLTGLACFSSESRAAAFTEGTELSSNTTFISFEYAREIALSKPGVNALMLADNEKNVIVHYVR